MNIFEPCEKYILRSYELSVYMHKEIVELLNEYASSTARSGHCLDPPMAGFCEESYFGFTCPHQFIFVSLPQKVFKRGQTQCWTVQTQTVGKGGPVFSLLQAHLKQVKQVQELFEHVGHKAAPITQIHIWSKMAFCTLIFPFFSQIQAPHSLRLQLP